MRTRRSLAVAVTLAGVLAGCTGHGTSSTGSGTGSGGTTNPAPAADHASSEQHATYGYAARTSGVDYQPDVVALGGGASTIRSASSDGLTWTIDRSAPGADRLALGKIMLLTSQAAGRVVAMHDDGDARVVTLAPVLLTDVLRNGSINVDQAVSGFRYQDVPGLSPGITSPTASELPVHQLYQGASAGSATLPPAGSSDVTIPVGKFKVKPYLNTGKLGVNVSRNAGDLKLFGDLAFSTSDLRIKAGVAIKDGKSVGPALRIDGITGLTISLGAGVGSSGSAANGKATITLPGEFTYMLPPTPYTAELPLTVSVRYKLSVSTALTGVNSTLAATGKYAMSGPIGFEAHTPLTPSFSVKQSILDSVHGISLGPSGVVVAVNFTASVGIGPPILNAGPNVGVTLAIGLANGSALGAPLARCKSATLDLDLNYGVGIHFDTGLPLLKALLPKGTKLEFGLDFTKNLLHRSQVLPNVALCGGG